jgi:hypothetical protein
MGKILANLLPEPKLGLPGNIPPRGSAACLSLRLVLLVTSLQTFPQENFTAGADGYSLQAFEGRQREGKRKPLHLSMEWKTCFRQTQEGSV